MKQRKNKSNGIKKGNVAAGLLGILFVIVGIAVIIPRAGVIGVIWTVFAIVIAGNNLLPVLDRLCAPELYEGEPLTREETPDEDLQPQLDQLKRYLDAGLITKQEYEEKREEILRGL